jgi:hypothetical protein
MACSARCVSRRSRSRFAREKKSAASSGSRNGRSKGLAPKPNATSTPRLPSPTAAGTSSITVLPTRPPKEPLPIAAIPPANTTLVAR